MVDGEDKFTTWFQRVEDFTKERLEVGDVVDGERTEDEVECGLKPSRSQSMVVLFLMR